MTAVLSWRNLVDEAVLSSPDSIEADFPLSNLVTPQLSVKARSVDVTGTTIFDADWSAGGAEDVRVVALLGHNASPAASAEVRLYPTAGGGFTTFPLTEFHESDQVPASVPRNWIMVLASDFSAERVKFVTTDAANPDGYLEAGRLWAGPALTFANGFGRDYGASFDEDGQASESRGGQGYGLEYGVRRDLSVSITYVPTSAAMGVAASDLSLYRAFMEAGTINHLIAIPRTDDLLTMHRLGVYGRFVKGKQHIRRGKGDFYKVSFEVKEQR